MTFSETWRRVAGVEGAWVASMHRRTAVTFVICLLAALIASMAFTSALANNVVTIWVYALSAGSCWLVIVSHAMAQMSLAHTLRIPRAAEYGLIGIGVFSIGFATIPALWIACATSMSFSALCAFHVCLLLGMMIMMGLVLTNSGSLSRPPIVSCLLFLPCVLCYAGVIPGVREPYFAYTGWFLAGLFALIVTWLFRIKPIYRPLPLVTALTSTIVTLPPSSRIVPFREGAMYFSRNDINAKDESEKAIKNANLTSSQAIAVLLGSAFTQGTILQRLKEIVGIISVLIVLIFVIGFFTVVNNNQQSNVFMFAWPIVVMQWSRFVPPLQKIFVRTTGDKEAMALLPGINANTKLKSNVIKAVFINPLEIGVINLIVSVIYITIIFFTFKQSYNNWYANIYILTLLSIASSISTFSALLRSLAGQNVSGWLDIGLGGIVYIAAIISAFSSGFKFMTGLATVLILCYFLLISALTLHAWREFQRRSHPFLLNQGNTEGWFRTIFTLGFFRR